MQSVIRFSLFGSYERFSTSNLDLYMKLIEFFGKRGYRPATANELQLQPNGQARVIVMPVFLNETGAVIEMTSNRINFQKNINNIMKIELLNQEFSNEFANLLDAFTAEFSIMSNRLALNCEIYIEDTRSEMPIQSSFFDSVNETEMTMRNATRKEVEKEE
ncbi:MAG: hypothetical protein HFH29_10670, partial [Eubacterium sp.]|nr:hypothetical protein [Eubacterium sp.]